MFRQIQKAFFADGLDLVSIVIPFNSHFNTINNCRIDNSEWMRNGDYTPTRMEAQNDAVTFLFNAKTQTNRENAVGLVTMAGKR